MNNRMLRLPALLLVFGLAACSAPALVAVEKPDLDVSPAVARLQPAPQSPVLVCRAGLGEVLLGPAWREMPTVLFSVPPGGRMNIRFHDAGNAHTLTLQAIFDPLGQKMLFCPLQDSQTPAARVACGSLYALEEDFDLGIRRTFDVPEVLRGAAITCARSEDKLKPLREQP